jgi:hypothetical protein
LGGLYEEEFLEEDIAAEMIPVSLTFPMEMIGSNEKHR